MKKNAKKYLIGSIVVAVVAVLYIVSFKGVYCISRQLDVYSGDIRETRSLFGVVFKDEIEETYFSRLAKELGVAGEKAEWYFNGCSCRGLGVKRYESGEGSIAACNGFSDMLEVWKAGDEEKREMVERCLGYLQAGKIDKIYGMAEEVLERINNDLIDTYGLTMEDYLQAQTLLDSGDINVVVPGHVHTEACDHGVTVERVELPEIIVELEWEKELSYEQITEVLGLMHKLYDANSAEKEKIQGELQEYIKNDPNDPNVTELLRSFAEDLHDHNNLEVEIDH